MFEIFDHTPAWEGMGDVWLAPETEPIEAESSELPEDPDAPEYPDMEVTYVLFPEEPGFDQVYEQASDWLEAPGGMLETFKIYPVNIS